MAGLTCVVSVAVVRLGSDSQLGSRNELTRYVSIECRVLHSNCSACINSKVKKNTLVSVKMLNSNFSTSADTC